MNLEVGRRVFVGSVVAGLPLLGGGAQRVWAQRQGGRVEKADPVVAQVVADMKRSVRALSKAPSAEQARRLASSLRLLSAWGTGAGLDAQIKETLGGVIRREGRQALLRRDADPSMFKAEAGELGFDGTSAVPLPALVSLDDATKQRIVDDLLANGVTARWRAIADMLDVAAQSLDRTASARSRGMTLIAQTDPSICRMINQELYYLNAQMIFWCAPWFYWVPEPCGLATSAYLGVAAVAWWYSC
jgi:GTPase